MLHADLDDLGNYFLNRTQEAVKAWFKLQKASWGAHISIVRGEVEADPREVYEFDEQETEFFYDNQVYQYHGHFCVNVICPKAEEIRKSLDLPLDYLIKLHLTIGVVVQPARHIQLL